MSTILELITEARRATGSDLATAHELGFHFSSMSKVRSGTLHLAPFHAARVAEITGRPWWEGLLQTLIERSTTPEERLYWKVQFGDLRRRMRTRGPSKATPKSHPEAIDGTGS